MVNAVSQNRPALPSRLQRSNARSVGAFVPGLTRKSFEKYGFSTATLLTDWAVIAGADLASFTLPERLKWPRQVDAFAETDVACKGRPGATLILRVDGPRAIEIQYQTRQITERINAHFGYHAVAEIRFIQAPLPPKAGRMATPGSAPPAPNRDSQPSPAGQDGLDAALARLQASLQRAAAHRRAA